MQGGTHCLQAALPIVFVIMHTHCDATHPALPADCDIFFRQRMKLFDWGTPLPTALGLGCAHLPFS